MSRRRRRERKDDKYRVGRSAHIPYLPGESARARHERRKRENVRRAKYVQKWCDQHGLTLAITNDGHHWTFTGPDGFIAEWWPSSAKLVFNKQWSRGMHVHDWEQAQNAILGAMT